VRNVGFTFLAFLIMMGRYLKRGRTMELTQLSTNSPIRSIFWPKKAFLLNRLFITLGGVLLLAFASQLSIPLEPVPLTFQSITVVFIGMAFGKRYGLAIVSTYLALGLLGLPIFADFSGGIVKAFGPTGGYLAGFIPAVWISGYFAEKGASRSIILSFIVASLGTASIFLLGISWLSTFVGWQKAIALGLMPFLLTEMVKLLVLSIVTPRLWKTGR
jgi:biotin transport system substrate-specific component